LASNGARKLFTIMVVPHSEKPIFSFRLSLTVLQVLAFFLVVFSIFALAFFSSYRDMVGHMEELRELRVVTREQKKQIDILVEQTQVLEENMRRLKELDSQLREMAQLGEGPGGLLEGQVSRQRPNLARIAQLEGWRIEGAGGGLGGGTPLGAERGLDAARKVRAELERIQKEMEVRQRSLESLREKLGKEHAAIAARPSIWPAQGYVTSGFGYRRSPFGWGTDFHSGLDIAAPMGSPVSATADGKVIFAGWKGAYGRMVMIDHENGFVTVYGHNSKLVVSMGQRVKKGEIIAYIGSTGRSTGPHVHYEIRKDGKPINPRRYLFGSQ